MNAAIHYSSGETVEPTTDIYKTTAGEHFAIVHLGGLQVHLPGFDAENVRAARAIAAELTRVADEIEQAMAPAVTPEPVAAPEPPQSDEVLL